MEDTLWLSLFVLFSFSCDSCSCPKSLRIYGAHRRLCATQSLCKFGRFVLKISLHAQEITWAILCVCFSSPSSSFPLLLHSCSSVSSSLIQTFLLLCIPIQTLVYKFHFPPSSAHLKIYSFTLLNLRDCYSILNIIFALRVHGVCVQKHHCHSLRGVELHLISSTIAAWCINQPWTWSPVPLSLPDSRATGLGHHFQILVRFLATHVSSLPHTLFKVERWKFHSWYISVYSFTHSLDFALIITFSFIFLVCFRGFCVLFFIDIVLPYVLYFICSLGGRDSHCAS